MDYWYDESEGAGDGSEELAEYRQQLEARAQVRRQRLAEGGVEWVEQHTLVMHQCKQELQDSPFWASVQAALRAIPRDEAETGPVELVCYGLGELDSVSASFQLALLRLLAAELRIKPGSVYVCSPQLFGDTVRGVFNDVADNSNARAT